MAHLPTICRAAMLACAGAIAMKNRRRSIVPNPRARCSSIRAVVAVARIVDRRHHRDDVDRHIDVARDRRHFGAVRRLFVSMPSVRTTMAARCGDRFSPIIEASTALAVSAIASYIDVCPNGGSTESTFFSRPLKSAVKSVTSQLRVEGEERRL